MSADPAAILSAVESYIKFFSTNDRAGYLSLFADDAWVEDPVGSPKHQGLGAIGAFWDGSRELAPEIEPPPDQGQRVWRRGRVPHGDPTDVGRPADGDDRHRRHDLRR